MKFNNEKGFTVIELILSFALVMILAISMFTLVNNYREKQEKESINRDLLELKNKVTQDVYQDMQLRKVEKIEYCRDTMDEDNDGDVNEILKQCIDIYFKKNEGQAEEDSKKRLKIQVNQDVNIYDDGTNFTIDTFEIVYGNIKYKNPDPKFISIVPDYILTYTTDEDNLEYGTIYKINIKMRHQDIANDYIIEIVTTGIN